MDTSTKIEQPVREAGKIVREGDLLATDLRSILDLYADWFDCGRPGSVRTIEQPGTGKMHPPEQSIPNIQRVEEATRRFLSQCLPSDLPVHFTLALIEALAYTASRFAAADRANGLLYRAAVLRILECGLLSERVPAER